MKTFSIKPILIALAATVMFGVGAHAQKGPDAVSFTGEVVNHACIPHKSYDVYNEAKLCTLSSNRPTSRYVFYDPQTNEVYRIKDQSKAAQFAAKDVTVAGYLNDSSHVFHITDIMPAS